VAAQKTLEAEAPPVAKVDKKVAALDVHQALYEAQKEFPPIERTGINPEFRSKYAKLDCIMREIRPVLDKHGLMIYWIGQVIDAVSVITTVLHHVGSGTQLTFSVPLCTSDDPQCVAKSITYYQRYGMCGVLGVVAEDDTDGGPAGSDGPQGTRTRAVRVTKEEEAPVKLDLQGLDVDGAVSIINGCANTGQLEIAVDGLVGGEAWLSHQDREAIIQAVRDRYKEMRESGASKNHRFESKMTAHRDQLTQELSDDRQFDEEPE
jgi:hypothetical protein